MSLFDDTKFINFNNYGLFVVVVVVVVVVGRDIAVPLSAFIGRLVLHTEAIPEQPVLSEFLELDLLQQGLSFMGSSFPATKYGRDTTMSSPHHHQH